MFCSPKKFILLALLFFLLPPSPLRAAKNAIGVRVARNTEHLSPSDWYYKYAPAGGGSGGPASISFAGYEAVSVGSCSSGQGETIYVNAANIAGGDLYTNIYIIACPIGADQDIVDIFEQLIDNWDFNVNITDKSEQAKIQRDTKRLSDLTVLNDLLSNYRENISTTGRYPTLASGTYEVGKSISSWVSWNETLGSQLNSKLPTPPSGQGWSSLTPLSDWTNQNKEKVWPKDMYFPTAVGIDYTTNGCRQITAVKDQKVASWCEGGCAECEGLTYSDTTTWPVGVTAPADIAVNYQSPSSPSCRELLSVQDGKYSTLKDNYSTTAGACPNIFSPDPAGNYIPSAEEFTNPDSISRGFDYNSCYHIFIVKENKWSEFTATPNCPSTGWTPTANLDTVPETLGIEWPEDIQNPDSIAMGWDKDGQRHIYAFKGNDYREYTDYNRPYVYKTSDNGLSYSLCTYFESSYPSLSGANCSQLKSSNYSPSIMKLTDQQVTIGNYFNYDIKATDIDGDELTWSIDLGCGPQTLGSSPITCAWTLGYNIYATNTSQKNIKKIYGTAPNAVDNRTIIATVSDGNGGTDTKSFKLTVIKSDLAITSIPPADITIGDDYQYDVEAYDPQAYYPLGYSWTSGAFPSGMNATSINPINGVIFGTPTSVGSYNVIATVTNTNSSDTVTQNFKVNVNNFNVVDIPNTEVPREHTVNFFAQTNPKKVNRKSWSIGCAFVSGHAGGSCADISYSIDPSSGEITITVKDSAALYDKFQITVTATSDLDAIGRTDTFEVMVSNPKCGNGSQEGAEQCDDGANGNDLDQCYDNCKFTYCGDGLVQSPNGRDSIMEECDKENPSCCDNDNCAWLCPPYFEAGPLFFAGTGLDYIEARSGIDEELIFPACRVFEAGSGKIDAEVIPDVYSSAVVYVTDTSGSMGGSMGDVKTALVNQMNVLSTAANDTRMIEDGKSIFVGLVEFDSSFTFSPIVDIQSTVNRDSLIADINVYSAGGGTSADPAFVKAVAMLNAITTDKKIIVFLGDGASGTDPSATTTNAKLAGIEIYGIVYDTDCVASPGNSLCQSICSWSSDSDTAMPPCWNNNYSYTSADAATVYATITSKIIAMPTGIIDLTINGVTSSFAAPVFPVSTVPDIPLDLSSITCDDINQNIPFVANYSGGGGQIKFYNAKVNICKSCYIIVYGDGNIGLGEQCDCGPGGVCSLAELGNQTCISQGKPDGTLGCYPPGHPLEGQFDYSLCTFDACVFDISNFDECSFQ